MKFAHLSLSAAILLNACTSSTLQPFPSSSPTPPAQPDPSPGAAHFPQTSAILALEKTVAKDTHVREVLSRRPGARVKLRQLEGHMTAYVVEQRNGKWFNVSKQISDVDLAVIGDAVKRASVGTEWQAVEAQAR